MNLVCFTNKDGKTVFDTKEKPSNCDTCCQSVCFVYFVL